MSCSPDLNKGITRAILNCFGTMTEVMDKLIMHLRGERIMAELSVRSAPAEYHG